MRERVWSTRSVGCGGFLFETDKSMSAAPTRVIVHGIRPETRAEALHYDWQSDAKLIACYCENWCAEAFSGERNNNPNGPWDVRSGATLYEVRKMAGDVNLSPSACRGKGRGFDWDLFWKKIRAVDRFAVVDVFDIARAPAWDSVTIYDVSADRVGSWLDAGLLSKQGSLRRAEFIELATA